MFVVNHIWICLKQLPQCFLSPLSQLCYKNWADLIYLSHTGWGLRVGCKIGESFSDIFWHWSLCITNHRTLEPIRQNFPPILYRARCRHSSEYDVVSDVSRHGTQCQKHLWGTEHKHLTIVIGVDHAICDPSQPELPKCIYRDCSLGRLPFSDSGAFGALSAVSVFSKVACSTFSITLAASLECESSNEW